MRREAIAVLSSGVPLPHRVYGNRVLLDFVGCDLSRVGDGLVPVLNAHRLEPLGHVRAAWVEGGLLMGELRFDSTPAGHRAFEMVETREQNGVSIGTGTIRPADISVVDAFGRETDFDEQEWCRYHQAPDLVLHAKRWQLLEVSMTETPLDRLAIARPFNREARRAWRRMDERQRSLLFETRDDDDGRHFRAIVMPPLFQTDPVNGR